MQLVKLFFFFLEIFHVPLVVMKCAPSAFVIEAMGTVPCSGSVVRVNLSSHHSYHHRVIERRALSQPQPRYQFLPGWAARYPGKPSMRAVPDMSRTRCPQVSISAAQLLL